MRAAGAIVLGKTAADDFAYHGNGTSSLTGQVRNPYDPHGREDTGRLERRLRGVGRVRNRVRRAGHRRRRLQSHSGAVLRRRRDEADVRTRAAHRRDSDLAVSRHARSARAHLADAALLLDAIAGPDASDGLALDRRVDARRARRAARRCARTARDSVSSKRMCRARR